jgi:hypothetical protein
METHVGSGRRDSIYWDILSFITGTFLISVPKNDLVLEKIIDLIRYCAPPNR